MVEFVRDMSNAALEERISDAHYRAGTEYERSSKKPMRSMVPSDRALLVLDFGCGTGLNAALLAKSGHEVVGVDISPVAIEKFCAQGLKGSVVNVEAGPLPLPPASFDLVYASEIIEHCVDTAGFLGNLRAVLKPAGTLLLSAPNSAFWAYRLLGVLGRVASEYQHPGHVRFFSKRSLAARIEQAGFEVVAFLRGICTSCLADGSAILWPRCCGRRAFKKNRGSPRAIISGSSAPLHGRRAGFGPKL